MQFIDEIIIPVGGFNTEALSHGLPALPPAFKWRKQTITVEPPIATHKQFEPDRTHGSSERYVRKHWFSFSSAGQTYNVYCARHACKPSDRWVLYSIDH